MQQEFIMQNLICRLLLNELQNWKYGSFIVFLMTFVGNKSHYKKASMVLIFYFMDRIALEMRSKCYVFRII